MGDSSIAKRIYHNDYLDKKVTEYVLISGRTPSICSQSMDDFAKYVAFVVKKEHPTYESSSSFNRDGYTYLSFEENEKKDLEHRLMDIRNEKQKNRKRIKPNY
jgi:hypothetical protein